MAVVPGNWQATPQRSRVPHTVVDTTLSARMGQVVEPIAEAFGTALIAAMATDTWQQARKAVAALWRRVRPLESADTVEGELESLRDRILAARQAGRADTEQALAGVWQSRCQALLLDDPALAAELWQVLGEILTPMLGLAERTRIGEIVMMGSSHASSTFNQVAGNQYNIRP